MPYPVMLFAAGFGTRMGALTADRPKPLIGVAGRTLLDHALSLARYAEAPKIVVNAHYKADQITDHLRGQDVEVLIEQPDILDTGGGLKAARASLGAGPVFTLNTDAVWAGPNPLTLLAEMWEPQMDALLLCLPPAQAIGHAGAGDFTLTDGRLSRGPGLVYSGAQLIRPEVLDSVPERIFSMNVAWDILLKRGALHGCTYPGAWCDVGHPGGITLAEDMLARHV
ncbi:nucleotidyltransferase family protein [Roseovarius sp. LXJ103]|uniref:nucleotidyltransferase family protein n=1 Tax=Roseovarius carneus TaxID=2853164 RepID=UPI000D620C1E|nr:nucleotidyltransferase family protein [Roseovarius carneus]MBZ8117937.1 nucleotidyltransferase family protein [Roseovarius carneus]PWE36309.1 nucleotidyltransferase [Pelagicola sp. LXJ1103]